MKMITLWEPFASLIAAGLKMYETRSWAPPPSIVGQRIGIHAAARLIRHFDWANMGPELWKATVGLFPDAAGIPYGKIVATAELVGVGQVTERRNNTVVCRTRDDGLFRAHDDGLFVVEDDGFGDYSVGRYVWQLANIEALPVPVAATGRQRIWNWTV